MGDTTAGDAPEPHGPRKGNGRKAAWALWLLPVLAAAAAAAGAVLIISSEPIGGWFGYAPVNTDFGFVAGKAAILKDQELAGWAVIGLGGVLLAFWAGYRLGNRRGGNRQG